MCKSGCHYMIINYGKSIAVYLDEQDCAAPRIIRALLEPPGAESNRSGGWSVYDFDNAERKRVVRAAFKLAGVDVNKVGWGGEWEKF